MALKGSTQKIINRAKFRRSQSAAPLVRKEMADAIRKGRNSIGSKEHRKRYLRYEN